MSLQYVFHSCTEKIYSLHSDYRSILFNYEYFHLDKLEDDNQHFLVKGEDGIK